MCFLSKCRASSRLSLRRNKMDLARVMSYDAPVCTYILVAAVRLWVSESNDLARIAAIGSRMRYAQQEKQQLEEAIFV